MPRSLAAALAVFALLGAACSSSDAVDELIEDAFVECMAEGGVTVGSVSVTTRDRGEHIETFTWDHLDGAGDESVGEVCVDMALEQFDFSRTRRWTATRWESRRFRRFRRRPR